jgi:hypothetical protein
MTANFIQSWPCTRAAKAVSVRASCPVAHLFGQSIKQTIVDELDFWLQSNYRGEQIVYEGRYDRDSIHSLSKLKAATNSDQIAIKFAWQYSKTTDSTLRVRGVYLPQATVEKLIKSNLISHFYDYGAIYDGCAVQINCMST